MLEGGAVRQHTWRADPHGRQKAWPAAQGKANRRAANSDCHCESVGDGAGRPSAVAIIPGEASTSPGVSVSEMRPAHSSGRKDLHNEVELEMGRGNWRSRALPIPPGSQPRNAQGNPEVA